MYPSLVLVQPRKTRLCLTERLLMGRKESNQTKTKPRGRPIGELKVCSCISISLSGFYVQARPRGYKTFFFHSQLN